MELLNITVFGEAVRLMPTRTLYWERTRTLFAANMALDDEFGASESPNRDAIHHLRLAVLTVEPKRIIMLGSWFTPTVSSIWRLHFQQFLEEPLAKLKLMQVGGFVSPYLADFTIVHATAPTTGPKFVLSDHPMLAENGYVLCPSSDHLPQFRFTETVGFLPSLCQRDSAPADETSEGTVYAIDLAQETIVSC